MPVLKLNGSVNWLPHFSIVTTAGNPDNAPRAVPLTLGGPHDMPDTQIEVAPTGRANIVMSRKRSTRSGAPVLALYCNGKPVAFNAPALEHVKTKALQAIRENSSASATVVGLKWPTKRADPGLLAVLRGMASLKGARAFVDPDANNCAKAKSAGFQSRRMVFADYVNEL